MRYIGLTSLLGMLLALPGFALDVTKQATWFGGHTTPTSVLTSAKSHRVTSNGVTKVQLRHLYKDDWLVTDVVGGGDWGESIVSNMHRVSMGVSSNAFAIEDLQVASRVADVRLDGLEIRADLLGPAITNVLNAIPVRAPYNSYTSFSERVPALRISSGDGIGFFVLCTDGEYRDLRYTTPGSASHRYDSLFDISSLYGREFSVSYLTGKFGNLGWTASLIPSADNIDNKLSSVCGGSSYPKCYGREATVRELLCDVLIRDPSLWAHSGFDGHGRDFVDLTGLSYAIGYSDVYARMAHLAAAQLRYDYDSGPVAGLVLSNANVRLSASGLSCSLSMRGGVLYNADIPESVSTVTLSVTPRQDMFGPRSESYHAMLHLNRDVTLSLDVPDGSWNTGPGTRRVTKGYRLVTVTRSAEYSGVYWYSMRLEELDNFTRNDFTSANEQLVSTVDSRLSSNNEAFVSAVESVNGKYLPLSGGTMKGDVTFETNGITLGSGGWIYGGGIATAGAGYQKHNLYHNWYYKSDESATEDPQFEIAVKGDISATNPTFSKAVLAVNVDFATNTTGAAYVAVTNALAGFGFDAEALAELPGGKVYGSIGALLAALAAAIAWLNKNKLDKTAVVAPSSSATAGQAADASKVGEALAMKAPSNITTTSDDKIRIVYGDNVWWIMPMGIYYWNDGEAGEYAHSPISVFALPTSVYSSSLALTSDIEDAVKNKVGSFASVGGASATVKDGVANLGDFFTNSNSLLTSRVNTMIDAKIGDVNAVLAAALDGTEVA